MDVGDLIKVVYNETMNPDSKPSIRTGNFKEIKEIGPIRFIVLDCEKVETLIPEQRIVRIENMSGMIMIYCSACRFYNWFDPEEEKAPTHCKRCKEKLK